MTHRAERAEQPSRRDVLKRLKETGVVVGAVALLAACGIGGQAALHHETPAPAERYALHKNITATVFWIGEPGDASNSDISNVPTAWDNNASLRFGGPDGPTKPNGGIHDVPRDTNGIVTRFKPLHNPYYFALPASEFDDNGLIAGARERSPWAKEAGSVGDNDSLFKGRWIRATVSDHSDPTGSRSIYAQWLDVGPYEERDYDYVFGDGSTTPKNSVGLKAGLDLSPAAAIGLGFDDDAKTVSWQFVDSADVPDGPWKRYPPISNKTYWD